MDGFDNVVFSNCEPLNMLENFEMSMKKIWGESISKKSEDFGNDSTCYILAKNEISLNFNYIPDNKLDREAYVQIIVSRKKDIHLDITVNNDGLWDGQFKQPEDYFSKIILNGGFEYTLITPDPLGEEAFSDEIFKLFIESLSG